MPTDQFTDEDLLMLSGIQHLAFCERQYALAYIEMQWSENVLTVEGHHLHERVDDPFESDKRGDVICSRAVPLVSYTLGLQGRADVVEFRADIENGVELKGRTGKWMPVPVEYKHGKPKSGDIDEVQLCAQAFCLEEMMSLNIGKGYIFYGEIKRRHEVIFTDELRSRVKHYARRMHELYLKGITPPPVYQPHCKSCSLEKLCMPKEFSGMRSAKSYLIDNLESFNS